MRHLTTMGLVAVLGAGCAATRDASKVRVPEPARAVLTDKRVFVGPDGLEVAVLSSKRTDEALLRLTGTTNSPIEGMVLPYRFKGDGRRPRYTTDYKGREWNVLVAERRYGRNSQWVGYIPGSGKAELSLDEKKSAALDAEQLYRQFRRQNANGEISALQRFDRSEEIAKEESDLKDDAVRAAKACGVELKMLVQWNQINDEVLKSKSIAGYCEAPIAAARNLCKKSVKAKRYLTQGIKQLQCKFGDAHKIEVQGQNLVWTVNLDGVNAGRAAFAQMQELETAGRTLGQHVIIEATTACTDGKSHYVMLAPKGAKHSGLSYGDGNKFYHVRQNDYLGDGWFFEPRRFNKKYNANFRGADLRYYSHFDVDRKKGTCSIICGERKTELKIVPHDETEKMVAHLTYVSSPHTREPYAIARDRSGTYYFVDRGNTPETRRDFRLYVGPVGRMKRQKMKDIVSDSEGEVFSSRRGELRLILGKQKALWIRKGRRRKLLWVPVEKNYPLIYNELGVYLGLTLGNPCDDF